MRARTAHAISKSEEPAPWAESPEVWLWAEVLSEALFDLHGGSDELRRQARSWFKSECREIGSFNWVAAVLDLSPSAVRKAIDGGAVRIEASKRFIRRSSQEPLKY